MSRIFSPGGRLVVLGLCTAALLPLAIWWMRDGGELPVNPRGGPQCGQWAVTRTCQLLGAPLDMAAVSKLLPTQDRGHSMLELAEVLQKIGFETEGRNETLETLTAGSFPCIAHLLQPSHFIVVSGIEGGRVHLFDGAGRRRTGRLEVFQTKWSGNVLWVRRRPDGGPLPAYARSSNRTGPCVQFDRLLIDRGNVPLVGEPVVFTYPFRNLGNSDLLIEEIDTNCRCLESKKPEKPIPPGGEGSIRLLYSVIPRSGSFDHMAVVQTNDPDFALIRLRASGNTDMGVSVRPGALDLGEIVQGEASSAVCYVHFDGDWEDFKVQKVTTTLAGSKCEHYASGDMVRLRSKLPEGLQEPQVPQGTELVELSVTPGYASLDEIDAAVYVHTNVKGFERVTVPVTGRLVPPVAVYPGIISFGEISEGEQAEQAVTLVSRIQQRFRILAVEPGLEGVKAVIPDADWHHEAEVRFRTAGAAAAETNDSTVRIEVELSETGKKVSLALPIRIWKRDT